MSFIPNEADAFHPSMSSPDSGHFETLRAGSKATGVVSGGAVTAQGTPDMTVAVASAVIAWEGAKANVTAGNLTLTADGTDPRFYLIVASSAGVKSAVAGTPAPEMDPPTEPGPVFPAIPATSVVLASVYVPAADTDIDANQIDDMRVFVVPPEPTTNYDLAKARSIPLVKGNSQTVTLDTGQNLVHTLLLVNGKLFATSQTSPTKFIRLNNLEDLTDRTSFTFASDGNHDSSDAAVYVAESGLIYVLFDHASQVHVSSVNPDTHAVVDVISDAAHGGTSTGGSICSDGTHLYVLTYTSPSKVIKYTLAGAFVAQLTLANNLGHAIVYDGVKLYATGASSPAWSARIDPSTLTAEQEVAFPTGFNFATDDLTADGDYLWIGLELSFAVGIWRVAKADLTSQAQVGYVEGAVWAMHNDGRTIWAALANGDLVNINPYTLDASYIDTGLTSGPNEIVSDGTGRLFVTSFQSPSVVMRLVPAAPIEVRRGLGQKSPVGGGVYTVLPMGRLYMDTATRSTTGTTEQTLGQSFTFGTLLTVNNMALRITVAGRFAANANNKRITIRLDASNYMFDTGLLGFNDARWRFVVEMVRTGAATQDWVGTFISDSSVLATDVQIGTTTFDLATSLSLAVRGETPTAAGDVTQELFMVEVIS